MKNIAENWPRLSLFAIEALSDEQAAALERELHDIVENDRYPFSPRIRTLREILHMIRPEPARESLPTIRHYEPPRAKRRR
jgi:hypothetical protein